MYLDALDARQALYVCRFQTGAESDPDADYGAHVARLREAVELTSGQGSRLLIVIIQDPGYPAPDAAWRKRLAEMTSADNFTPVVAFVTTNPVIRGVLTAIAWITKPKYEPRIVATIPEALDWLQSKRGQPTPRLAELIRQVTEA